MALPDGATLRVVPVGEADLLAVAGVVNRAFAIYSDLFTGQRTSPEDYALEVGDDARVMLLEDDGRLLATSMVAVADRFTSTTLIGPAGSTRPSDLPAAKPAHPWQGAFYYGLAGVEPGLMKRGLGKTMIAHAERMAKAERFSRLALGTVREFGLVDYYERFGYMVVHEEPFPVGHWEFVVPHRYCEMVKDL
jgi:GNAT superfamily N-acetyltransferase